VSPHEVLVEQAMADADEILSPVVLGRVLGARPVRAIVPPVMEEAPRPRPKPCTCLYGTCEGECGYDPAAWDAWEASEEGGGR
jgi:hypothetical protein